MQEKLYGLPFDINNHKLYITQGRDGPWSHKRLGRNMDLSQAVDFALPIGSKIIASRSGFITAYYDRSEICYQGLDPEVVNSLGFGVTNFIAIDHGDNTTSIYSHLAKGGVLVNQGRFVKEGDIIALSGLSGWIGANPHVHFQVNDSRCNSLPVLFKCINYSLSHKDLFPDVAASHILHF